MTTRRIRTAIQAEFEAGELRGRGTIRNQIPDQGDLVSLSFRDPKGRGLGVSGLVWWTTSDEPGVHRAPGFGIRLLEDSDDYRSFFESLC